MLQQSLVAGTLPDVLMLDNPDLQQIAATGALSPLDEYGLCADGYVGRGRGLQYEGGLYGLQPVTNTVGLFYNKDILDRGRGESRRRPGTSSRTAAKQLTTGKQYGVAFAAPANYEGTWQFLPFMWSNGGNEKNIATPQIAAGAPAAGGSGQGTARPPSRSSTGPRPT